MDDEPGWRPTPHLVHIYVDGAAEPNPGPSAAAYLIFDPTTGEVLEQNAEYLGRRTNNEAEYTAIVSALDRCKGVCRGTVYVYSDSQLCVNQINGVWRVKASNLGQYVERVFQLRQFFSDIRFDWVPRENAFIQQCDQLASEAIRKATGGRYTRL